MSAQTRTKKGKKAESVPALLNVAFVWDMSGSMGMIEDATREGTGGYIADLQKEEKAMAKEYGEGVYTRFSLTAFDTVFEPWIVDSPIASINRGPILARYQPRGGTALYDAIARTITELDSRLVGDRANERCLVIVMTDGEENASTEYALRQDGRKRLFNLISAYEAMGNWTFVYLGANVDAYAEAMAIGIPVGNAAYYSASAQSVKGTSSGLNHLTRTRRSGATGQSVTAFADAGLGNDYRDKEDK